MAKTKKYYVVWFGNPTGIFDSWAACKKAIAGISGAQYKSFSTREEARRAYDKEYKDYIATAHKQELTLAEKALYGQPNLYSIAVDAATSGNPGRTEYQGVDTQTGKRLFHQGPFEQGTNNVGEFLALVHGLAYLKKMGSDRLLYTDSKIAMGWVKAKTCRTKLKQTHKNKALFELVARAEDWLKNNRYTTRIVKWETKAWGEIPADFGRK